MSIEFEWDDTKAKRNVLKHGVSFEEASTIFADGLSVTIDDPLHARPGEDRFVTMGMSNRGKILVVVHADRGDAVRIISARPATRKERQNHEERG